MILHNRKVQKTVWMVLAAVIVPAFVFWGFGSFMRDQKQAKALGKGITPQEYEDAMAAVKNLAVMQFGDNFTEIKKYLNLEEQAKERIILLKETIRNHVKVDDKEVVKAIQSYPFFKHSGRFDKRIYEQLLQYMFRTQPRVFEEQTRENIKIAKLYDLKTKGITASEEEIRKAYGKENEKFSLYYIAAIISDIANSIKPQEDELTEFYKAHSLEFKQPTSFNLEYLVSDSEAKIKEVLKAVSDKKDLAKAAEENKLSIKETGLFTQNDPIPGMGWSLEVSEIINNLKINALSPIIRIENNYYALRLKERKEPYIPEFKDIKDKVKNSFTKNKANEASKEKIESCLKELKKAYQNNPQTDVDFEKYAKTYGLKYAVTDTFAAGSYIEGVGASDDFFNAASKLTTNGISDIITNPLGSYIIKIKSSTPIDEEKFKKEKADFSAKFLSG
ncbi:hypothetical protein EPO66_05640, partial [bacterium]